MTETEILEDFSELTSEDINVCINYVNNISLINLREEI